MKDPIPTTPTRKVTDRAASTRTSESTDPHALVEVLASESGVDRVRARQQLVREGREAVPALVRALRSEPVIVRWEAAKALAEIDDPRAIGALVDALDDRSDIRWIAAEALAARGSAGVIAVLHGLATRPDTVEFRDGAHHVILEAVERHELGGPEIDSALGPVLDALEHNAAEYTAPVAADRALGELHRLESRKP